MDENVLVVPRSPFFEFLGFLPFKGRKEILNYIEQNAVYKPRGDMENNLKYKQVVPYIVFVSGKKIFLMKRKKGEPRLRNFRSIGIGGHITEEDKDASVKETIENGLRREFHEEVFYKGPFKPIFLGFINNDLNAVSRVHFGLLYTVQGDDSITIKDSRLEGRLVDVKKIPENDLEEWSKIALREINKKLMLSIKKR